MKVKLLKILSTGICSLEIILPLTSCSNANSIIFANFESYMSTDLMKSMTKKYNARFLYYATNEEIEIKFTKNYDLAVPSTYELISLLQKNELMRIEWNKFNLSYKDISGSSHLITNGTEALNLFTDNIQKIIKVESNKYNDILPENTNLLDFGIPYFLQSFIFAYKGNKIDNLNNNTNFNDLLHVISPKYNKNVDPRFLPKNNSKIAMVDDSRTVYDMCKLIQDQQDYPTQENNWNINPSSANISINEFKTTYNTFTGQFNHNSFYLNSDSNEVLTSFAEHNNGNNSIFAYNGDILYAIQGGGLYDPYEPNQINIVNPIMSPLALDMVVFNKKNIKNTPRLNKVYDLAYDILLNGTNINQNISATDSKGNYIFGPMINFDFVQYTSPLKAINDYVINGDYFNNDDPLKNKLLSVYNIPDIDENKIANLIEDPISELNKSNMHWAYVEEKEKL